jgi:hypothetical protein
LWDQEGMKFKFGSIVATVSCVQELRVRMDLLEACVIGGYNIAEYGNRANLPSAGCKVMQLSYTFMDDSDKVFGAATIQKLVILANVGWLVDVAYWHCRCLNRELLRKRISA